MSKHNHDEPNELHFEQIQHKGVQYEDRDLGARGILVFLVVLGITGLLLCVMVWGYFDYHARHMRAAVPLPGPQVINTPNAEIAPPETRFPKPALQTDDVNDLNQYRQQDNARLSSYGYIDQKNGIVHIPIDQAMDQIVKQGLPTRPAPGQQAGNTKAANAQVLTTPAAVADFGSGADTVAGAGGGVRPENNR